VVRLDRLGQSFAELLATVKMLREGKLLRSERVWEAPSAHSHRRSKVAEAAMVMRVSATSVSYWRAAGN
jgi:hypothetical protein